MTRPEERLAELLHDTTPEPVRDLSYEAVVDRVRARRRSSRALAVGGTAIVAVLAVVGVAALAGSRAPASGPGPAVTATPSPPPKGTIDFQGVRVTIPAGWSLAQIPTCGYAPDRTVEVGGGVRIPASCPASLRPPAAVRTLVLDDLYEWTGGGVAIGAPTTWHGQPAVLSDGFSNGAHSVSLMLPWLNVAVYASGHTNAEALALLDSIVPRPSTDMGVPEHADAVEVVWQPVKAAEGHTYVAHVTRAGDVATLLADLRAGAPVTAGQACMSTAPTDQAILTVRTGGQFRTFAARFGTCGQLTSGRGVAVQATDQLRRDVRRLAPLVKPYVNPSGCEETGGADQSGVHGPSSAQAALVEFLAGRPSGFPRRADDYTEVAEGIFLGGHTEVVVNAVLPPGTGYAVEATSTCGWYY